MKRKAACKTATRSVKIINLLIAGLATIFIATTAQATDSWISRADMPTARQGLAVTTVNNKIHVFGGGNAGKAWSPLQTTEEFDHPTKTSDSANTGEIGGPCYPNGTCNAGLICNNNICEQETTTNQGDLGEECYANATCNTGLTCNENNICEEGSLCGATPGCEGCCISYMSPESIYTNDVQAFFMLRVTGCRFSLMELLFSKVTFDGPGGTSVLKAPTVLVINDLVFGIMEINQNAKPGCYEMTVQTPLKKAEGYSLTVESNSINSTTTIPSTSTTSVTPSTTTVTSGVSTTTTASSGQRFTDNNNGTVTDTRTNLIWLKNANPCGAKLWDDAKTYCSALASGTAGLTDGSIAGMWRLPTVQELEGIGTDPPATWELDRDPSVTWTMPGAPFSSVQYGYYWSGTSYANDTIYAWCIHMASGDVRNNFKSYNDFSVWPVRDGNAMTTTTSTTIAGGDLDTIESIYQNMVEIPAGSFKMGCSDGDTDCYDEEKPQHTVTISSSFKMSRYEITQGQWQAVMGSNPSGFNTCGKDCPVEQVSWDDIQSFITTLNSKTGKNYKLPTEAEWEYAARAGTTTKYYCGNDESCLGNIAWYDSNSDNTTHAVGKKIPNSWGLYDMSGNVFEWVQDWLDMYSSDSITDPQGHSSGSARGFRGGSWKYGGNYYYCRSSYRGGYNPSYGFNDIGFRLCLR